MAAVNPPLLLVVDGNSLVHRAHHALAGSADRDPSGRPIWALRGLVGSLAAAAAKLTPDALLVGFDAADHSVRKAAFPDYKAQRPAKPPELSEQLEAAPAVLAELGVRVVVASGYEADDVLASAAALARRSGWRAALVTSDRDAFALIDSTTSVLRVLNGGMEGSPVLTESSLPALTGVMASQYRDYAALRGDTSDNLPGAAGIGAKTAARLLSRFVGVDDAYAAIDTGRTEEVVAAIGVAGLRKLDTPQARERVRRNQRLMALHADLELPPIEDLRLPLDPIRVRTALRVRGLRGGAALWALLGEAPPAWHAEAPSGNETSFAQDEAPPDDGRTGLRARPDPEPPPIRRVAAAAARQPTSQDQLPLF